jgi:DNA-binding NarL/FixJ family response regulator
MPETHSSLLIESASRGVLHLCVIAFSSFRPFHERFVNLSGITPVIRVAILEDEREVRDSLALLLSTSPGFQCVGSYSEGRAALNGVRQDRSEVVLVDINLAGENGIDFVRQLKAFQPATQVLMLTVYEDAERVFESLLAGANGYLLKRTPHERLLEAVREVLDGGSPMTSQVARKVVQHFQCDSPRDQLAALSPREQQVLHNLAQGYLYKEIATHLDVSIDTIRKHVSSIYTKLHVANRTEATLHFLRNDRTSKP